MSERIRRNFMMDNVPRESLIVCSILIILLVLISFSLIIFDQSLIYILLGIVGLFLLWLAFLRPEIFLVLALWTNFLKGVYIPYLEYGKFGVAPYMLFTTLAVFGYFLQVLFGQKKIIIPPGFLFFSIFAFGTTITFLIVQDLQMTLGVLVRTILQWIIFFLLVQIIQNRQTAKRFVDILLIQAVVVVSWGIITGLQMNYFGWNKNVLLFWNQLQKNEYATYLGFVLVLSLAVISKTAGKNGGLRKITALILVLLIPLAWIFTYSRSGLLGIIAAFVCFMILDRGKKIIQLMARWLPIVCLVLLIVLIAFSFEAKDLALDGLLSIIQPDNARFERNVTNIQSRIALMEVALKIIVEHPLKGIDSSQWLTYAPLESGYLDPQLGERVVVGVQVHNRYLSIAVQNGLITLAGYLGLLFVIFSASIKARRYADPWLRTYINALLAAFIGYQVALLFIPEYLWEWPILGILLGLVNIAGHSTQEERVKKVQFRTYRVGCKSRLIENSECG